MGTRWGYYCEDCGEATGRDHNHGADMLAGMALVFPKVKAILDDPGLPGCLEIRFGPISGGDDEMQFLNDHFGHRIGVESEYGERVPIRPAPAPRPPDPPVHDSIPEGAYVVDGVPEGFPLRWLGEYPG